MTWIANWMRCCIFWERRRRPDKGFPFCSRVSNILLYEEVSCVFKTKWQKKYEKAMDSVEFWRKFYREQYDKTWDKNPEQANEYLGIAIALGDTLRDMKRIAEG